MHLKQVDKAPEDLGHLELGQAAEEIVANRVGRPG